MSLLCSAAADLAGDAREGTAPRALHWFLLEHQGPWGPRGLADSRVDPQAVAALVAWGRAVDGRVLLIRRPGRARGRAPRRWFRVDVRPGHESIRTGTFTTEAELDPYATGAPDNEPLYLACAHGKHDTCCAVRGRPLAAALDAAEPGRVWECSHVGGCRFAPAALLLPHGFVLGGVPATDAAELAAGYRAGELDSRWLRGRSALPPAVQVAQHHARAKTGASGVDALTPVEVAGPGPDWRVRLAGPACTVTLHERTLAVDRQLTCAAKGPGTVRQFDLVELTLG